MGDCAEAQIVEAQSALTRQQIRLQERALAKRGQAIVSAGLPPTPDKRDIVAVAFVLVRMLRNRNDPHRAVAAAGLIHGLNEVSTRKSPGTAKLACAKGCGHCCHNWVGATVPEVLLLAAGVRSAARAKPDLIARIVGRTKITAGLSRTERFGAKLPCPLLVDSQCSFYRERPAVCRQTTSLDLAGCLDEFEGRGYGGEMKVSSVYLAHARNSRVPLSAALRLAGLDMASYELSAALARALERDDTELRWLAGEDVMAGIAKGPLEEGAGEAVVAIERELAPLMRDAGAGD